jgi:RimJ/RimL family protein N-acetyltransferase
MIGTKCYLSPIDINDADKYTAWLNDMEITQYLTLFHINVSEVSEREILSSISKDHNYGIIDIESNKLIGNCGLMNIDHINRTCEIGIFIGDKMFLNKGYGKESMTLLINYAFIALNINNILLRVYSFNERAISCYTNVGFKVIGRIRNAITRNRKKHDIILMDIIPEDYYREDT